MATSNTALRVADLDFFSIRDNLKNYLRSQSEFTDYDFEGSGMAVLLDVLAYNTYYNSFYLNMAANEAFLDTAQLRQSILSHAKMINYVPTSSQGAQARVNILVTPGDGEPSLGSLTLDKYTRLYGRDKDGVNYPFVTINTNTSPKSADTYSFSNVIIKQGEVVTHQFLMSSNNISRRFEIPSSNVDTSTLIVTVQESSSNTLTKQFKPYDSIVSINGQSLIYYLEESDTLRYTVYFGDDVISAAPKNGNIITITYLDTVGAISNSISSFVFTDPVGGVYRNNVNVSVVDASYGGMDKETIEQIRFRAPQHYVTQNRAVTVNDYESIITKDYSNIDSVSVWGGEDNDPPVYGKVFMSLKTKRFYTLSNLEKENIKNTLISNRNVLTVTPEIVDPDYVYMQIRGKIIYDPILTSKTSNEILQIVKTAIANYTQNELNTFKSTFKKSKLQFYIENSDPAITASDIYVFMQRRIPITTNTTKNYTIAFNSPLRKGDYIEKLYTYPQLTVSDKNSVPRNVFIEEVPDSFTGVDSISVVNGGINYTTAPTVTITGDGIGATATATLVRGRVEKIEVTNRGSGYTAATVTITGDGSEASAVAVLEARNGTLRSFYYKSTGEKVVVSENAGTINYATGQVILTSLNPSDVLTNDLYEENILTVNVVPDDEIISPLRNRIITIDSDNIQSVQLEMIAAS